MRTANKYSVQVTNRFQLADSSDSNSEDESACQNVDPYAMMIQAQADATKQAKLKIKEAQKAKPVILKVEETKQETTKQEPRKNNARNREPRANNAPRRGPRNERMENNDNTLSENNNQQTARNEGDRRDNRKPKRDNDRRSGNPRTGVKATEKKGGHGAGNWGKATEKPSDFEDKPSDEQPTPEEAAPEKQTEEPAVPEEPAEPEEITLTLEEYYAQNAEDQPCTSAASRKANDGQAIGGKVIRKNKIFVERKQQHIVREANTNKCAIPNEQLAFVSGRQRNYRYNDGNNNNDRRPGGNRRNFENKGGKGDKPKNNLDFSQASTDFPELGK